MDNANAMTTLLNTNLGIIIAFDNLGVVRYLNDIAKSELHYESNEVNISDIFVTVFNGEVSYDDFVRSMDGEYIKTVAYRKNNTCFPIGIRFSTIVFEDVGRINLVAGLNLQREEDMIRDLKKAEEETQAAMHARDEFVANITHELRTPVNGIKGHVKNLLDTETDKEKKESLSIIMKCCTNMEKIINNLLDYSKMEAGKFEIVDKPFHIRQCIEDAMETSRCIANEKGLTFTSFISEEIPDVIIGDELRITQIVNNLISNAIKFTAMGSVTLEAYRTYEYQDLIELTFFVTDTGIGLNPEEKEKLFKSFSQVDGSITRKYGGTGLGLYVTKQLVELMKGHIEVESEKGKGSTFTFSIRVKLDPKDVKSQTAEQIEMDIKDVWNNSLGNLARGDSKDIHTFGSESNKQEIKGNIEKLCLCIDMENWERAEQFAENIRELCSEAEQEIKSIAFRLVMAVRKGDHDKSMGKAKEISDAIR